MDFDIKALQNKELILLKEIKRICDKNNIQYFLTYGTLIGAVRHKGFIPWDDDIDVGMTPANLKKFETACKTDLSEGFFLQNRNSEPEARLTFAKLRLNNSTLIVENMSDKDINHGICIDIYPLYNIADNPISRKIQLISALIYMLLETRVVPQKSSSAIRFGCTILLFLLKGALASMIKNACLRKMEAYESMPCSNKAFLFGNVRICKMLFPSECFSSYDKMQFEDDMFSVPNGYDILLHTCYGDYMKLPPIEDQGVKLLNVIKVDTEKSYLQYKGIYYCKQ